MAGSPTSDQNHVSLQWMGVWGHVDFVGHTSHVNTPQKGPLKICMQKQARPSPWPSGPHCQALTLICPRLPRSQFPAEDQWLAEVATQPVVGCRSQEGVNSGPADRPSLGGCMSTCRHHYGTIFWACYDNVGGLFGH